MMSGLWEDTPTVATSTGPSSSTVANVTAELKIQAIKGCDFKVAPFDMSFDPPDTYF